MIYFEKKIQATVINKFYDILKPGGFLFVGHSESLMNIKHKFKYVEPTIYQK
jgi:chemotaxis protein methyltransferase CheR